MPMIKEITWVGIAVITLGVGRELVSWHTDLLRIHYVDFPWGGVALWILVGVGFLLAADRKPT